MRDRVVRVGVAALSGALWWLLCGLAAFGIEWSSTRWAPLITLVVNQTVPSSAWQQLSPWNVLLPALGALLFGGLLAVGFSWLAARPDWESTSRTFQLFGGWVVAALAAGITAAVWAIGAVISQPVPLGVQSAFLDAVPDLLASALFGVVWGWLPALILSRMSATSTAAKPLSRPHATDDPVAQASPTPRRRSVAGAVALTIAIVVVLGAGAGVVAAQPAAARAGRIAAGGSPNGVPRYTPPPTPRPAPAPPAVAPTPLPQPAGTCAPEDTSLTVSGTSGALGHRAMSLVLMNSGANSCTVDGYPDIAFATQTGARLSVPLTHGSSYTATDPGPTLITLAPGASAQAHLGWGATGATTGTAGILWAAAYPGAQRTQLAISSDITPASPVTITAWATPTD